MIERVRIFKLGIWLLAAWPLLDGIWRVRTGERLGAEPIETLIALSGTQGLWWLAACLCASPLTRLTKWAGFVRARRLLGLIAAFYAALHLGIYLWLDQSLAWGAILSDWLGRPYQWAGLVAMAVMVALAATSHRAAMRRLGPRWAALHRWVYLAGLMVVLHLVMQAKDGETLGLAWAVGLVVVFGERAVRLLAGTGRAGVARPGDDRAARVRAAPRATGLSRAVR